MTERNIVHGTFNIERTYDAPRARVYAAFATLEGKAAWFEGGDGYTLVERIFDFREGGHERAGRCGGPPPPQRTGRMQIVVRPAIRSAFAGSCRTRIRGRNGAGD